jgi:flavodoxin
MVDKKRKEIIMAEKLVIYDSVFGNTEKVAQAIGDALGDVPVKKVDKVDDQDLSGLKILIVGSPTRGFQPTPAIKNFLKGLAPNKLQNVKSAAFDTRIPKDQTDSGFLKFMINIFGYADKKIEKLLTKAGAEIGLESTGFGVTGTEGPLVEGELERAKTWVLKING